MRILTELSIPYLKTNGFFIPLKGKLEPELSESKKTISYLNCDITAIQKFNLPSEKSERTILKIIKHKATPEKYPRHYDQILKKPLK